MAVTTRHNVRNQRMQFRDLVHNVIEFEFEWDPASVNSNSFVSEDVTIPGVTIGDMVLVSYEGDQQDLIISGHTKAANIVNIHMFNPTPGAINLPAADGHIIILQLSHRHP